MKKILVIGSLNMDIVIDVDDMPFVGETVLGRNIRYVPGGKGANQAYAAAKLGSNVTMLGCVGTDDFGNRLLHNLEKAGVNTASVKRDPDNSTGTAVIYVNKAGNNSIVVVPGANKQCSVGYLKENDRLFEESDYILLQMEIPPEAVYYAVQRGKQLGKPVILNPAPAPIEISPDILKQLDYIIPNETELAKLSGSSCEKSEDVLFAAYELIGKGAVNVLVTLGEKGALLVNENGTEPIGAEKVNNVVDTTAAGDCFIAAFTTALAEEKEPEEAVLFANAAASITVTRAGAQSSIPSRAETDLVYAKHHQKARGI